MRTIVLSLLGLLWAASPAWGHSYGVHPTEMVLAHVAGEGGENHEIVYENGVFTPSEVEVAPGDRVIFINRSGDFVWPASNIHPTHEIYPGFDPEQGLEPGQAWAFGFTRPGLWKFHNHLSPAQGGMVVVTGIEQPAPLREEIDPRTLAFAPLEQPLDAATVQQLLEDDDALTQAIATYGPAPVVRELSRVAFANTVSCHQRAHTLGHIAYDLFGVAAFALSGHECQSGSYHGATEALFRERGTSNLANDVATICKTATNTFFRFNCIHGIGHGLMAWTNYELHEALGLCDHLDSEKRGRDDALSCYSGVFMENVVGGLSGDMGHITKYLSQDDPHFPCNILDKKYVSECYFYQTSHMIRLFRGDFRALAIACGESPSYAHDLCFRSMGRDVGDWTTGRPEKAIEYCGYLQDEMNRARCIYGAAEAWFWEASGAAPTIRMCRLASETASKAACYRASIERARYLVETPAQMASFCAAVEPGYQAACLRPVHGGLWETFRAAGYEAYEQGNYPEAEKQLAAAVKEAEWFGPLDPHLAMSLNDLGEVYRRQLRYAEAEALHKRALAIREKTLGPDHPDVARSLENYAALLRETGRGAEANEMEAHAKAVRARHAEENPAN